MVAKLSMQCPEVNGFLARIEEMISEGELSPKKAMDEVAKYTEEHVKECPTCAKMNADNSFDTGSYISGR
jgi:hypothetical protein